VVPSNFEEDYEKSTFPNPTAYCSATCAQKAKIVLEKTIHDANPPSLVISSDTIVVCDGIIYEKPMDRTDAVRILTAISGKTVDLVTAVTMLFRKNDGSYEDVSFEETTEMYMEEYGSDMIDAYLNTGESWMGFSGAFSYQSAALLMITGITGCFYNAIGFPCSRFYKEFKKISSRVH
jgi:septum formation protein